MKKLLERLRDSERRKFIYTMFGGKMLGVAILIMAYASIKLFLGGSPAFADAAAATPPTPAYINPINTMWVLVTAFLVFFMQAGFMGLEAGFARSRETINVLLEGVIDTCLCGVLFYAWGFAWMFGAGNGFCGNQYYFLQNIPETYGTSGVATLAFFLFQFAFADCTSTITSGAMVGRT